MGYEYTTILKVYPNRKSKLRYKSLLSKYNSQLKQRTDFNSQMIHIKLSVINSARTSLNESLGHNLLINFRARVKKTISLFVFRSVIQQESSIFWPNFNFKYRFKGWVRTTFINITQWDWFFLLSYTIRVSIAESRKRRSFLGWWGRKTNIHLLCQITDMKTGVKRTIFQNPRYSSQINSKLWYHRSRCDRLIDFNLLC